MERESIHGNDVSSRAGLPVALCHSQRNSKLSGLEASARLVTQDAGAENGLGVARRVDQQQLQGTAEVLLRSGPRSSTPPVHEFIQKPEKPATLVAPRLAAGSGRALKQNKSVVRWSGECHGCLTAGFFQDAAQPSGSFTGRRRCDGSLVVGSSRPPSERFSTRRIYRYLGANGTPNAGRFPKNPLNFVPQVPRDPALGGPVSDDFAFGRELAPINAKPPRYVFDNLIAAADWLTRALDIQGYRVDDVKGLSTEFLLPFLNSKSMKGQFAVGEFFDGNRVVVNQWIFNPTGMQGRPNAFDFPLKFVLNAMCSSPGGFNMAELDHAGLVGISPLNAVTFVENHDTDLNAGEK